MKARLGDKAMKQTRRIDSRWFRNIKICWQEKSRNDSMMKTEYPDIAPATLIPYHNNVKNFRNNAEHGIETLKSHPDNK